jgi:hypothetical protein
MLVRLLKAALSAGVAAFAVTAIVAALMAIHVGQKLSPHATVGFQTSWVGDFALASFLLFFALFLFLFRAR